MDLSSLEQSASKRRKFRIQSEFGRARQWRSRKSRPCDACRRRKTACIIDTRPPCRFCRGKGLDCRATSDSEHPKPAEHREPPAVVETSAVDEQPLPEIELVPAVNPAQPAVGLTGAPSPPWTIVNDDALEIQQIVTSPDEAVVALPINTQSRARTRRAALYTLEDGVNLTAHSMGLSGEQDTELLASFRSAVMNEVNRVDADIIQVCPGDLTGNRPPVHFSMLHDEFAPLDNVAKQAASNRIEAAVDGHADGLVRLYFKHVHPVYPVLSKTRFLRAYSDDKTAIPASVRGAVYGLASNFWRQDPEMSQTLGFNQHELFEDALGSLQREFHGPNLWTLQACLLLIHENPAENATIESPRVWTLSSQAVACAQMIGLHRDPAEWNIAPWEKCMRRKLWWATFAADVWSSVCHGNPPHIYRESFTTASLTMEDMAFDEDVPLELRHLIDESSTGLDISASARFYEGIAVSRVVHELLLSSYTDVRYEESMQDPLVRENTLLGLRTKLHNWESLLPRCVTMNSALPAPHLNNAPVHLSFYSAVALLFRALMSPVTKAAKRDPTSNLRRYFNAAVKDFAPFTDFMNEISPECLHAFWGLHARSQLILCGNFLIYLFLLAPDPEQVQDTFQLLGRFHDSLQRLSAVADKVAINLLRPVALRIDSFFTQAAQIMRTGPQTAAVPARAIDSGGT
ncbi:Fungal specific transcription factor domain-containing protein [Pleurostoma richardsiae]|uniref:Fungal specific transcription factor domain-containing protein n=1 Tax=Pleurostoma richardsiae TaxID=41990 RepID=A0AA38VMN0_9PEZI|nr:Fungal specific transcription factor domain-containing protein [Pleurostoma richardsiae]